MTAIRWTPALVARLGAEADVDLARELGVSRTAIAAQRKRRGIPAMHPSTRFRWTPDRIARLGTVSDSALAREYGTTHHTIARQRETLGLPPCDGRWTPAVVGRLGTEPDARLARELGITAQSVAAARIRRGIAPWTAPAPRHVWTDADDRLLGTMPDAELATRIGATVSAVQQRRHRLQIRVRRRSPWTPDVVARLGQVADAVIARETGLALSTVQAERQRRGILLAASARLPRAPRWTAEEDDEICRRRHAGERVWEIAQALQRSILGIRKRIRGPLRQRCPPTDAHRNPVWNQVEDDTLRARYAVGAPVATIADLLERTTAAVHARISALGLTRPIADRYREILDGLAAGTLPSVLANQLGMRRASLYAAMHRMRRQGIAVPTPDPVQLRAAQRAGWDAWRQRLAAQPRTAPSGTAEDCRWLAGVIDVSGGVRVSTDLRHVLISVDTCRRELVEQIFLACGLGTIRTYVSRRHRTMHRWSTTARDDVRTLAERLLPYLRTSPRRTMLAALAAWPADATTGNPVSEAVQVVRARLAADIAHARAIEDLPHRDIAVSEGDAAAPPTG